jgi:hypothetical protein
MIVKTIFFAVITHPIRVRNYRENQVCHAATPLRGVSGRWRGKRGAWVSASSVTLGSWAAVPGENNVAACPASASAIAGPAAGCGSGVQGLGGGAGGGGGGGGDPF